MHLSSFLLLATTISLTLAAPETHLQKRAVTLTVDVSKTYQTIDGFGFSEAFQRANQIVNLPAAKQRMVLDVFFNTTSGAGMSILRNGIGSSSDSRSDLMNSILVTKMSSPSATPNYTWDGKDSGQLFVSKEAQKYGVKTFYANAWSAPPFMKTNNNENNGGYLCGVSGQNCASGDWKQAYANYLVQYVRFYESEGVKITHLGFLNEPDFTTSYASMLSSGTQAADFIKVLYPTLKAANMSHIAITCCDSTGWNDAGSKVSQLKAAGVENQLGVITSHTYTSNFNGPLKTSLKVWQTEYSDLNGGWTTAWYQNGGAGDGMTWASILHNALVNNNCSGYLYWVGTQWGNTNEKMIKIDDTTKDVQISKRVWAFAQYSRYIRPGAMRVAATGAPNGVSASAFLNEGVSGSLVVPVLNTGTGSQAITVKVGGGFVGASVTAWITDNSREMAKTDAVLAADGTVTGTVPGRSFVTFVLTK
ncbi:hypothetical protein IFR04_010746 [Cadophora malorum]|uniref:Glycoside hydrolase family 30 protein n=1 Tax=Cadophora malorum TaxID=108018 RepID=A0A8H7TC45_9HELO|nr:hypothetical protein IFR04_010746 [Cadophora malorum]